MARKKPAAKPSGSRKKKTATLRSRAKSRTSTSPAQQTRLEAVRGADHRMVGRVRIDVGRAGSARVKRVVYPSGFRWSKDMKPVSGTDLCMHAHVGFLASGQIHIEYADGCVVEHKAPQIVAIEPGHDGWVVGREPAVLIEFDFERDTVSRLGMPDAHRH